VIEDFMIEDFTNCSISPIELYSGYSSNEQNEDFEQTSPNPALPDPPPLPPLPQAPRPLRTKVVGCLRTNTLRTHNFRSPRSETQKRGGCCLWADTPQAAGEVTTRDVTGNRWQRLPLTWRSPAGHQNPGTPCNDWQMRGNFPLPRVSRPTLVLLTRRTSHGRRKDRLSWYMTTLTSQPILLRRRTYQIQQSGQLN
jgi:hypothetical protein